MDGQKIHEKTGEDRKGEKCFLNMKVLFVNYKSASCNQGVLGGISIRMFACMCMHECIRVWYNYNVFYMHRFPKSVQQPMVLPGSRLGITVRKTQSGEIYVCTDSFMKRK